MKKFRYGTPDNSNSVYCVIKRSRVKPTLRVVCETWGNEEAAHELNLHTGDRSKVTARTARRLLQTEKIWY
jgi:hypothetical protein